MVEFLTFFLGLTTGVQAVELSVAGPVAEVEVRLDGKTLATLTGAPWVVDCDLGDRPLPHDLVAIARDAEGKELDRTEMWINLAPRQSAATLAVDTDERGHARALRVDWQSIGEPEPEQIEATFDGRPLDVTNPDHIPLPDHETQDFHYVSAAIDFSGVQDSRRDAELGGVRVRKISTQLTAVVVNLDGRQGLPAVGRMRSWFLKDGQPLAIHGVEKGPMELYVVRAPGSQAVLDELARTVLESSFKPSDGPAGMWRDWDPAEFFTGRSKAVEERIKSHHHQLTPLRYFAAFNHKIRLYFVSPRPGPLTPAGIGPEMFAHSRTYAGSEGGLSWLVRKQPLLAFEPQVGEAVALAGLTARAGNRRRAVLLITANATVDAAADASGYSPADTRALLRALQVPLYVWSLAVPRLSPSGAVPRLSPSGAVPRLSPSGGTSNPGWGEATDLGELSKPGKVVARLQQASAALQRDLKDQRVVWLEGRHLPQQIELAAAARGIRLAGSALP